MNSIVRICRLCLETISGNDCDAIEEITSRMLENLLLKVDLSLSEDPLICKTCAVDLDKSINFKTICLSRDSLDFEECKTESLTESHKSCRFCMKQFEIDCCIYLNDTKENVFIAEVMQTHIPELELNLAKEVNACKSCFGAMQDFSSFVTKCLNMEDTINTYAKSSSVALGQINLCDVQQLIFKSTIKCEASCSDENSSETVYSEGGDIDLKVDIKREEYAEVCNLDLSIKSEEIDIKAEHCESERFQEPSIITKIENGSFDISAHKSQERQEYINQHELKIGKGISMYKCETCPYETRYRKYLKRHKVVHKDTSELTMSKCDLCTYETKYSHSLKRHKLIHKSNSETTMFKCELCAFETKHQDYLKRHKMIHKNLSEIPMFKCELCPFEAKYLYALKQHNLIHTSTSELTMFECEMCPFETKYKRSLAAHKLTHKSTSEMAMFKCEQCPFETKYKRYLERHKLMHKSASEITMFKCELCPFETKRNYHLTQHKLTHKSTLETTMFKCELCPFETKYKRSLAPHKLTHDGISENLKCKLCPFETKHRYYLKQHKLTHKSTSKLTLKCELRSFETKRRDYLKQHETTHTSGCEQCPHAAEHNQCLDRHKLSNKGTIELKIFQCKLCPYATKRRDHLKIHELKHKTTSDITMFKCDLCPYETKRKDHLRVHKFRHKTSPEITMFKCEQCPYESKYQDRLKRHELIHESTEILK